MSGVLHETAHDAELAEALGWEEIVNAAPASYSEAHALATWRVDRAVGFGHDDPAIPLFNRVVGLGVLSPATADAVDEAIDVWAGTGRTFVVHASADNASAALIPVLETRRLKPSRGWAKLVRGKESAPVAPAGIRVEQVGPEHAATFADIAAGLAGLPDIAPWLGATVGRDGWHSYVAFDQDTPVYVGQLLVVDDLGWLFNGEHGEVERPDAQEAILARRIADALALGCRCIVTEAGEPGPDESNAGYSALVRAGFEVAYLRRNWIGTASTGS
jgi:hypothetical protein